MEEYLQDSKKYALKLVYHERLLITEETELAYKKSQIRNSRKIKERDSFWLHKTWAYEEIHTKPELRKDTNAFSVIMSNTMTK